MAATRIKPVQVSPGTSGQILVTSGGVAQWDGRALALDAIGARITSFTNQVISTGTPTNLSFTAEELDTDAFVNLGTDATRITIPSGMGGAYLVGGAITCGNPGLGPSGQWTCSIVYNSGAALVSDGGHLPAGGTGVRIAISAMANLADGDYIQLQVLQTIAATQNLNNCRFFAVRLGAT